MVSGGWKFAADAVDYPFTSSLLIDTVLFFHTGNGLARPMKVRHIKSLDVWLLSKGNRVLYRGHASPWKSPGVIAAALRRDLKPRPGASVTG